MPYLTVIIPYFKKIKFFQKTLKSVINQTYKNIEIIIIYDDEDKKELIEIKSLIKNKKNIKLLINKKNHGAGISRNKAAKVSKGKYLAFIDADDIWKKEKLNTQLKFMKKKKYNISHTSYSIIDSNGIKISRRKAKKKLNYKDLLDSCDIGLSTVIINKNLFLKNKFSSNKTKEDYSMWLKISKKNIIYGINKDLTLWRKTKDSLSSDLFQKFYDAFDIYYNQEKFNIMKSIFKVFVLSLNYLKKNTP